jgi:beta-glucosidase
VASIVPSVKQLRKFEKIELSPGETKTVSFQLNKEDLAFVDVQNHWITEPGYFDIAVGPLKSTFYYANNIPTKEEKSKLKPERIK